MKRRGEDKVGFSFLLEAEKVARREWGRYSFAGSLGRGGKESKITIQYTERGAGRENSFAIKLEGKGKRAILQFCGLLQGRLAPSVKRKGEVADNSTPR